MGVVEGEGGWEREEVLLGVPPPPLCWEGDSVEEEEGEREVLRVRVGESVVVEDGEMQGVGVMQDDPRGVREGLMEEEGVGSKGEGEDPELREPLGDLEARVVPVPPRPGAAGEVDEVREGEGVVDGEREVERVTVPDLDWDSVKDREGEAVVVGLTLEVADWVALLPPLRLTLEDTLTLGVAVEEAVKEALVRALLDPGLLLPLVVLVPPLEDEVLAVEEGLRVPRDEADGLGLDTPCNSRTWSGWTGNTPGPWALTLGNLE